MSATNTSLTPLEQAHELMRAATEPARLESERVPLDKLSGRVLAADLLAPDALPRWDYSAMDGYALAYADAVAAAGSELRVSQRIPAGRPGAPLLPCTAARIFTGSPIPPGADTVVKQEDCLAGDGSVRVNILPVCGANVRLAGEDIARGSLCLGAGARLDAAAIGLAASLGIAELPVRRRLKVTILATGDELVRPGLALAAGQIYGSNNHVLYALLARAGCDVADLGHIEDTPKATQAALSAAARDADLVITTGGVSVGEEDHVRASVDHLGRIDLWRLDIKPGKPLAWGRIGATPFVGLPGNPVSAFVTYLLAVVPLLRHLQGMPQRAQVAWPVRSAFTWQHPDKRREFLRARVQHGSEGPEAIIFSNQSSGAISSVVWMEGLIDLPGGKVVRPGDTVRYLPLADLAEV